MDKSRFNKLRRRAEAVLKKYHNEYDLDNSCVLKLIEELTLSQVELEIQNEDLIKAQSDLVESRSKYIELYELAPVAYFAIDKDALIKEVNQAGCELLGLKKHVLINRCFSRFITSEYHALFSQYKKAGFINQSSQSFEIKMVKWNQPSFYAAVESKVINDVINHSPQMLLFVSDITIRKKAEYSLHRQRTKMASIDRLRSLNELILGIAEEQNNSLTIINNYIHGCIRRFESSKLNIDDIYKTLKIAAKETVSLSEILRQRINNTAKTVFLYEYININLILTQLIALLNFELDKFPVTIFYEQIETLPIVKLDVFHIQQAILNIARNAIEAMYDANIKEPKLLIEVIEKKDSTIEISLLDNGPGLRDDLIPKLFNPHFTTKSYAVGLGLSVSKAIIEKHGGHLFAMANPTGGACFKFTLPIPCAETLPLKKA